MEVEDLVQEVLLVLIEALNKGYLHRGMYKHAVINALKKYSKGEKTRVHENGIDSSCDTNAFDETFETIVREAINELPPKLRDIVQLASHEELTITEMAKRMSLTRQTVSKRLGAGKKALLKIVVDKRPAIMM